MKQADYVIRRFGFAVFTIWMAITINFFLFRVLPGTAVTNLAHAVRGSLKLKHALTIAFGLNKPKWEQYFLYIRELFKGNMGISYTYQQPVTHLLLLDLKNTVPMVTLGTLLAIILGVLTGILSAWRRGSKLDHTSTNLAVAFYAFPTQFLGLMLLILLGGLLPTAGMTNPFLLGKPGLFDQGVDVLIHMLLPALTLCLTLYGEFTLIMRSSMLETMGEDYVLTARGKGLPDRRIISRHVLRNAILPIATMVALSLGWIVAGAILIEYIFSWPGIGLAMWQAIDQRDYPMLQGGFLVLAASVILLNFLSDILYFKLDPRISG